MSASATADGSARRVLFVVSNDFGELSLALGFARGQEFAARTTMLLPGNLFSVHEAVGPMRVGSYDDISAILHTVEEENPSLVFLFSGYLLSNNKLISRAQLQKLIVQLHARGCVVVTSDPWLGLAPVLRPAEVSRPMIMSPGILGLRDRLVARWRGMNLVHDLTAVARILSDEVHLYPTRVEDMAPGPRRVRFHNPQFSRKAEPDASGRPSWLFVLSTLDAIYQSQCRGAETFLDQVEQKLGEALLSGRLPVLIGPPSLIDAISDRSDIARQAELVRFCSHDAYTEKLLGAEYVFFWNIVTFSMVWRVANGLPLFFFDIGHLVSTIQPMRELAARCHYGGREPELLDIREPLDPAGLESRARDQLDHTDALWTEWQTSPTPDQLIRDLVESGRATPEPS